MPMRLLLARTRAQAECGAGALDEVLLNGPAHCYHAGLFSEQSRWVIDAAKAKYPGKPIKQLVLTHHQHGP
jgi:hypothetical protein